MDVVGAFPEKIGGHRASLLTDRTRSWGVALQPHTEGPHVEFVRPEVSALVKRECLVKWADVRGSVGSARPRPELPVSVGPENPQLVEDARSSHPTG